MTNVRYLKTHITKKVKEMLGQTTRLCFVEEMYMAEVKITFQSFSHFQVKKVLDNFRLCNLATVINRALLYIIPKVMIVQKCRITFDIIHKMRLRQLTSCQTCIIFLPNMFLNIRSYVQLKQKFRRKYFTLVCCYSAKSLFMNLFHFV